MRKAQAKLITKTDFDAKLSGLHRKCTKNKTDHLLVQNELNHLKAFDSTYYNGKSYFEEDGKLKYLIFQPLSKYFKLITTTKYIYHHGNLKDYLTKPYATSDNSLTPYINRNGKKIRLQFNKNCLIQ